MRTMKSKSLVQGTAVWIAALCLSLLMLAAGCNFRDDTSKPEKDFAKSSLIAAIGGSGSTFISPLMTVWINDYQKLHPDIQINYRSIGSGSGVDEFRKQWTQFAASDAPLTDDQVGEISHTVQIPVTAGPVCIIYNLPELKTSLRLSSNTLAGIYLGKIVNWRDPAIEKDNPGVKLPQLPVIVVHRSDRSGTTSIFTDYLTRISPGWARRAGQGLTVTWAVGLSGEGTTQVVNLVKQTLGTIGYVELSYAVESKLPVASIQNRSGNFVPPTPASTTAAVEALGDALERDARAPIVDPPASAEHAYPIAGLTFLLVRKDHPDVVEQQALQRFLSYVTTQGQDAADELSYARLPANLQQEQRRLLGELTFNRKTIGPDSLSSATSLAEGIVLVIKDRNIRDSRQLQTLW